MFSSVLLLLCLYNLYESTTSFCQWPCIWQYLSPNAIWAGFTRNFFAFWGCKLRLEAHTCAFACQCISRGAAFRYRFVQVDTSLETPQRKISICLPHSSSPFSPFFNLPIWLCFTSWCSDRHYRIYWKARNVFSHVLLATLIPPFFDLCLFGWQGGHVVEVDSMWFKESVKRSRATSVPQQVGSVWLESDDGTKDGWAEFCSLQPRLICFDLSELSFLISSLHRLATSFNVLM